MATRTDLAKRFPHVRAISQHVCWCSSGGSACPQRRHRQPFPSRLENRRWHCALALAMAILVEPVVGAALMQSHSPSHMGGAAYQAQPAGIDVAETAVHDTDGHDDAEVDEDDEDVGQPEPMAPELLSEAMVRSGFLLKRGDKRKVGPPSSHRPGRNAGWCCAPRASPSTKTRRSTG